MPAQQVERKALEAHRGGDEVSPVPKIVVAFFAALRKVFGKAEDERRVANHGDFDVHEGAWKLRVSIEADEVDGGFVAECLDVPGAMSQGETEREALESLIDAIQGVVAARIEEHLRTLDLEMPSSESQVVKFPRLVNVPL